MTDDRLRAAERAWRDARDDESAARFLRELRRVGHLDEQALHLAALLGYAPARELLAGAAPAEPDDEEWPEVVARATAALGQEGCLRAVVEAAWQVPIHGERFDGPDDHAMRVLEVLDDAMLVPAEERAPALARATDVLAQGGGWGGYNVLNLAQLALAIAAEPENAASLLRDALTLVRQVTSPPLVTTVARAASLFVLGLDDPSRARRQQRGRRFGAEPELVRAIAFSPDGQRVATTCRTGFVTLRDATSGEALRVMRGRVTDLFAAAFTRDGARVLVGGLDGALTAWDPSTGEAVPVDDWPAHAEGVTCLDVLPDGRIVSGGYDMAIRVWPATGRDALLTLEGHERTVWALAPSPDGALLASGGSDGRAVVWDLRAGVARFTATHPAGVTGVAFTPDGAHLLTSSDDGHLRRWDVATGQELAAHRVSDRTLYDLALSPDGALAATVGDGAVHLTRVADGAAVRAWSAPGVQLAVAFSPDGAWILGGARSGALRRFDVV